MSETPHADRDRDERLSSVYRATAPEAPPPSLDDAIRAAARRAVAARPQRAGAPFARNWQMPLSLAAVLVLCVSLVVVMRDEGSELTQAPRANVPMPAARLKETMDGARAVPKIELAPADAARSKNVGLKPPPANPPAAGGADQYALATPAPTGGIRGPVGGLMQEAKRDAESVARENQSQRAAASAFPGRSAAEPAEAAAATAGKLQARRDVGPEEPSQAVVAADARSRSSAGNAAAPAINAAESAPPLRQEQAKADRIERDSAREQARPAAQAMAKPAPAAPAMRAAPMASAKSVAEQGTVLDNSAKDSADVVASMMRLPPEKWLERIEDLRRQGRVDEARAGFAEFRKRYPDHVLPTALRDWARQ
jgi:hypothetical protein